MSKLAVFQETSAVAIYMQAKFPQVLLETSPPLGHPDFIPHPPGWALDFALEVDLALDVIARAFRNQVSTDWDVQRYADRITMKYTGISEEFEETMHKSSKPLATRLEVTPCTITDRNGWLLVWYLPNILRPERQVSMFDDLKMVEKTLKTDATKSASWRSDPKAFHGVPNGLKIGNFNISPAWFEQGHQSEEHFLKVSAELKDDRLVAWLKKCRLPFALIGGILSIIQPELYDLGLEALRKLELHPELCDTPERMLEILGIWYAPFSTLSVISNRATPLHCDIGGRPEWVDLMLALGKYDNGRFNIPAFGYTFKYNPGTMIAFSSKIFRHGTTCEGNRAGIAFYMHDSVMNRLGVATGQWLHRTKYRDLYPPSDPVYTYYSSV